MELIHGDCLEEMKNIESNSVNLVVIDPPYNIGKSKEWDSWEKQSDYVDWLGGAFLECQRVLKDNGSFYFFHNDFLQLAKLQEWINQNTRFIFKQFIVWNKKFNGAKLEGYLQGHIAVDGLRNYKQMAEYCLFYTFQDETGLKTIDNDLTLYKSIRDYFKAERAKTDLSFKVINEKCFGTASNGGGMASNILTSYKLNWTFPTREKYEALQKIGICQRPYSELRQEYEALRQEYEALRYTFNNGKTHHSVWDYEIAPKEGHITPKPVDLIENIIRHSSNEGDVVLDCFMGSGTTGIACHNLNREFIGIEKNADYYQLATQRIADNQRQQRMF
jgi:site-specific DNA-methyltransferase (adenine-specific)